MTTYFLLNKKNSYKPTKLIRPSSTDGPKSQNGSGSGSGNNFKIQSNQNNDPTKSATNFFLNTNHSSGNEQSEYRQNSPSNQLLRLAQENARNFSILEPKHRTTTTMDNHFSGNFSYNEPKPIILGKSLEKNRLITPDDNWKSSNCNTKELNPLLSSLITKNPIATNPNGNFLGSHAFDDEPPDEERRFLAKNFGNNCKYYFDDNSLSNINSEVMEQKCKKTFSPALSRHTAFSFADTTKATIQSEESLDKLLDDDVDDPYDNGPRNRMDESLIYNISSNSSNQSCQYGQIIKKNYAKECIENNFHKNQFKPKRDRYPHDDYCISFQNNTNAHNNNNNNNYNQRIKSKELNKAVDRQNLLKRFSHLGHDPTLFLARHHRHYQAHNSPLIVHRFYHIDSSPKPMASSSNISLKNNLSRALDNHKIRPNQMMNVCDDELINNSLIKTSNEPDLFDSDDDESDDMNSVAAAVNNKYSINQKLAQRLLDYPNLLNDSTKNRIIFSDYENNNFTRNNDQQMVDNIDVNHNYGKIKKKQSSTESLEENKFLSSRTDSSQSICSLDSFTKDRKNEIELNSNSIAATNPSIQDDHFFKLQRFKQSNQVGC